MGEGREVTNSSIFGYEFADHGLLEEALTTPSFRMSSPGAVDNQRLEFLGDAVLGMLTAERLYARFPNEAEGKLTVRRTHLVSTAALCAAAANTDLAQRLRRNRGARPLPSNSKTYADAVEAIIGAAYLDGGFGAAKTIYRNLQLDAKIEEDEWSENPKGELQVLTQSFDPPVLPEYTLVSTSGKAHAPIFTVRVVVSGVGEATASAGSHKDAEAKAAIALLKTMRQKTCGSACIAGR